MKPPEPSDFNLTQGDLERSARLSERLRSIELHVPTILRFVVIASLVLLGSRSASASLVALVIVFVYFKLVDSWVTSFTRLVIRSPRMFDVFVRNGMSKYLYNAQKYRELIRQQNRDREEGLRGLRREQQERAEVERRSLEQRRQEALRNQEEVRIQREKRAQEERRHQQKRAEYERQRRERELLKLRDYWLGLDGNEFERALARLFEQTGFEVLQHGKVGDMGVDLVLSRNGYRTIVQCKAHKKPIGRADMMRLFAAREAFENAPAIMACLAGATKPASEYAAAREIQIMDIEEIIKTARSLPHSGGEAR